MKDPLEWAVQSGAVDDILAATGRILRRRRRRRQAAACGLAMALVGAAIWLTPARRSSALSVAALPSGATVLVPERQTLPDGTVVELRDGARISVAFTDSARLVHLKHGEALFQVAKNPRRPFIVQAGSLQVRAVGTAFAVNLKPAAVDVLVTEGRVALDAGEGMDSAHLALAAGPRTLALVDAGHDVTVDLPEGRLPERPPAITDDSADEMQAKLAWRAPRLRFSDTPLDQAVELVNRYGGLRVRIADPSIRRLHLTGMIRADNVDTLVGLLEAEPGVVAERQSDGSVALKIR